MCVGVEGGKTPKLMGMYALGLIHLQLPAKGTQLDQKVLDISLARSVHWQGGDGSLGLKGKRLGLRICEMKVCIMSC